jgi:hypothetical protein
MIDMGKYQQEWVGLETINTKDLRFQCRANIGQASLDAMVVSIAKDGQLVAFIVWGPGDDGRWIPLNGNKRLYGIEKNGIKTVLVIKIPKTDLSEKEARRLAAVLNVEQDTFDEIDYITNCWLFYSDGIKISDISKDLKLDRKTIYEFLAIFKAGPEVQQAVKDGRISIKNAAKIASVKAPENPKPAKHPGQADESVVRPHFDSEDEPKIEINAENTAKLVDILKSPDYKKLIKNLLNEVMGAAKSPADVPGIDEKLCGIVAKRDDFLSKLAVRAPQPATVEQSTGPQVQGQQPVVQPGIDLAVTRPTSAGYCITYNVDANKDTEDSIKAKIDLMETNAKHLKQLLDKLRASAKAGIKERAKNSKDKGSDDAEVEKKAAKTTALKSLETALKSAEKAGIDTTAIKQQIQAEKAKLKSSKPAA